VRTRVSFSRLERGENEVPEGVAVLVAIKKGGGV